MDIKKEIVNINVHNIFPNAYQPRKFFNEEALEEFGDTLELNQKVSVLAKALEDLLSK